MRIALASKASLNLVHVEPDHEAADWYDFPGVRETLHRWGVLPEKSNRDDIARLGIEVEKELLTGSDPLGLIEDAIEEDYADLAVLATHPRADLFGGLHGGISTLLAQHTHVPALLIPAGRPGFVSADTGAVELERILVPVDDEPDPRGAVSAAAGLASLFGLGRVEFTLLHVGQDEDTAAPIVERVKEATDVRYEFTAGGRTIKIEDKDSYRKRHGGRSPDYWDSVVLAFIPRAVSFAGFGWG